MAAKTYFIIFIIIRFSLNALSTWIPEAKMYHIENEKFLNWTDANKHCQSLGMQLLSIKSIEESNYLKEYIKNKYERVYPYWLGAFKENAKWKWLAYHEDITPDQMRWHEGEPNNKSGNELCIHTWDDDFDWNDNDCERQLPFICELQLHVLHK